MFRDKSKKEEVETQTLVAFVEPVADQARHAVVGALYLSKTSNRFFLRFMAYKNGKSQCIDSIFQSSEGIQPDGFSKGANFEIDCRNIDHFLLEDTPKGVLLTISCHEVAERRKFQFKHIFNQLTEFIFQIFLNGIAVPSFIPDHKCCLQFYPECNPNQFIHNSINLQPTRRIFETFEEFWKELVSFSESFIKLLFKRNALDRNDRYPLTAAAAADLQIFMDSIKEYLNSSPSLTPVTLAEFPTLFDSDGKMKDPASFKERAFYCGIEEAALPDALPFLFFLYAPDSTSLSRKEQDERLTKDFNTIRSQVELIKMHQLKHHRKLKESSFDVIHNDALRTDRDGTHLAFKHEFKTGMNMLVILLKVYCLFNQNIGYVQGMNDLFVPIMLTYLPKWDEETGDPIDDNGKVVDHEQYLPKLFWIYDAMMRNVNHDVFLTSFTSHSVEIAAKVMKILNKVAPLVVVWMKRKKLANLLFMYHDFIYLYKRSFSNVWDIWLQFHCSPDPTHWIVYFVAAIVLKTFPLFSTLPDVPPDQWLPKMMDSFPAQLQTLDIRELGRLALWFCENYPIKDEVSNEEKEEFKSEFFDIDWLKK
ncbi:hypothetical protein TRFO_35202 [Tritrichomonas foetus]|uniref:Rab-GAP TBC domain-containing protein n=1 Tax=Tritrichomonas foetus TaxID=1144522 RepID=A0A1J4JMD8_9EUKA|nr:hypothetical protein TRFO_35202 [Tritrichomonas foetus]|eukprot:OHS98420.1 hypothetical protein TRFO_35202 [Tritrichomonas foetus]